METKSPTYFPILVLSLTTKTFLGQCTEPISFLNTVQFDQPTDFCHVSWLEIYDWGTGTSNQQTFWLERQCFGDLYPASQIKSTFKTVTSFNLDLEFVLVSYQRWRLGIPCHNKFDHSLPRKSSWSSLEYVCSEHSCIQFEIHGFSHVSISVIGQKRQIKDFAIG